MHLAGEVQQKLREGNMGWGGGREGREKGNASHGGREKRVREAFPGGDPRSV